MKLEGDRQEEWKDGEESELRGYCIIWPVGRSPAQDPSSPFSRVVFSLLLSFSARFLLNGSDFSSSAAGAPLATE